MSLVVPQRYAFDWHEFEWISKEQWWPKEEMRRRRRLWWRMAPWAECDVEEARHSDVCIIGSCKSGDNTDKSWDKLKNNKYTFLIKTIGMVFNQQVHVTYQSTDGTGAGACIAGGKCGKEASGLTSFTCSLPDESATWAKSRHWLPMLESVVLVVVIEAVCDRVIARVRWLEGSGADDIMLEATTRARMPRFWDATMAPVWRRENVGSEMISINKAPPALVSSTLFAKLKQEVIQIYNKTYKQGTSNDYYHCHCWDLQTMMRTHSICLATRQPNWRMKIGQNYCTKAKIHMWKTNE